MRHGVARREPCDARTRAIHRRIADETKHLGSERGVLSRAARHRSASGHCEYIASNELVFSPAVLLEAKVLFESKTMVHRLRHCWILAFLDASGRSTTGDQTRVGQGLWINIPM